MKECIHLYKITIIEIKNSFGLLNKDRPITLRSASYAESSEENTRKAS